MTFKTVKTKIVLLNVVAVLMTVVTLVIVVLVQKGGLRDKVNIELDQLGREETAKIAKDVYLMCRTQHETLMQKLHGDINVARDRLQTAGDISFAEEKITWNAINQYSKNSSQVQLSKMMVGDQWLGQNYDSKTSSLIVDEVKKLVGGTCTIFQRMNSAGDMLRVCTNVQSADGSRAIGTYIPAVNPDGKTNPVIASVLKGEAYYGQAFVVNAMYLAGYEPIFNSAREVIGILYVGVPQDEELNLRKGIMDIIVGKTGYVFVLGGKGDARGNYIISMGGVRDGENIWSAKDTDGNLFIQELIQKGLKTQDGAADFVRYPWQNEGESFARMKVTAVTYFEPWDWIIGAGTYVDDYRDAQLRIDEALNNIVFITCIAGLLLFAIFAVLSYISGTRIANPLQSSASFAQMVAEGDLTQRIQVRSKDEVGVLTTALNQMVEKTSEMIKGIQQSAEQVASSSEELSASSQNLANSATEQAAHLEETSASIEQLGSSIRQNSENAKKTNEVTVKAAKEAESGGQAVLETVKAMKKIADQITVIDEIADQTNLLALNAAIEAARAGEMGKGFAVVAVEVRKLAERSQQAAKEISTLAKNSVVQAEDAGNLIQQVVPEIQNASKLMEEISSACAEQTRGATQIRETVTQLDQVTQQNSATSEESASASEELAAQAQMLQEMVSHFKINEKLDYSKPREEQRIQTQVVSRKQIPAPSEWKDFS
ncbi:MAG: methyl-accepting chemotaxis protein [Candidatus Omnitrophota bacterium]|jgi:methyl-accepting chemotaxis protein|nr:MAG: methyl-accepting chemotaxis protein [Candidatus Omnitrophota bacterium]